MDELIGLDVGHGENTWEEKHSKGVVVGGVAYEEHHFNSRVALKTKKLLEHNGFRTIMGQQPFTNEVSLANRIKEYNKHNIILGFSFHANAASPTAKGLCAFYWGTSAQGKKAAEIYARLIGEYGYPKYSGGLEPSQLNHWTNFAMLRDTKAVWLLTENGFMTNAQDFQLIFKAPQFEDYLAEIHCKIACEYVGRAFKPLSLEEATVTPTPATPQPAEGSLTIGSTVTVKPSATHYETGQPIANFVKGNHFRIIRVKDVSVSNSKKAYLLDGIMSWVYEQDIVESGVSNGLEAPKPTPKPVQAPPKKRYVVLPSTSDSWRIYPTNKAPVKANAIGSLNPKKFGGLEYEILGNPQADVYTIKTSNFGVVNIYAAPSTGAVIVTK